MHIPVRDRSRGSALITLMVIILLASVAGAAMVGFAKQQAYSMTRIRDYLKAQSYAEAGANQAYAVLKQSFANASDAQKFPYQSLGDGSYDATVSLVGSNKASIVCVGRCGNSTITVKADVWNQRPGGGGGGGGGGPPAPAEGAYLYAIMSNGKMNWSGSGTIDIGTGRVHGNGVYKMTGSKKVTGNISSSTRIWLTGSTKITGDAAAPTITCSGSAITGTKTIGPVANISLPPIDLTPYYNHALANGQVYSGNQHFSGSSDLVPAGGIMWVNGNLKISTSGRMIGCFIATGTIDITGSGDQIKVADYPAFVSRDASIDIAGSGKSHGLIYAKGDFDKTGSGDTVGSIMCGGNFDAAGSWCAMAYENSTPVPPGGGGGGSGSTNAADHVVITAWQQ